MKNIEYMQIKKFIVVSIFSIFDINPLVANAVDNQSMNNKTAYQVIQITNKPSARLPMVWKDDRYLMNLGDMESLIQKDSESGKTLLAYIAKLKADGKQSFILKDTISRDDRVYYSKFWKQKNSILKIVDFKTLGLESDLNEFLGPFASIPTYRYGVATYELNFANEKIRLTGPAFRTFWSLRKHYWSSSQVYLPLEADADEKIAILELSVPIGTMNHLDYHGIYAVIPQHF